MQQVLIELHYLPSIEYFCILLQADSIIIERHEHFVKQTYRNRCHINTANGLQQLVVPVIGKQNKVPVKDILIDYRGHWQRQHWGALKAAYGRSPFFAHYEEPIYKAIFEHHRFLYDLNWTLLSLCLKFLNYSPLLTESTAFEKVPQSTVTDLRSTIIPKVIYSHHSFYSPVPYQQVFGNKFVANSSFIDLLMCEGPCAGDVVRSSMRVV